jgi:hypothetical protein
MKHSVSGVALAFVCAFAPAAYAQGVAIQPVRAGDCSVTITLPPNVDPASVRVTLDSPAAPVKITILQRAPFVAGFSEPLRENSDLTVQAGTVSATQRVAAAAASALVPTVCPGAPAQKVVFDERETFESSGFLGEVFDNFAPTISGNYAGPATATDLHSRLTAGVEAQYRVVGKPDGQQQLWFTAHVLHGMRSAEAACKDTPTNADCLTQQAKNPGGSFNYIIGHASTMEAHMDVRWELFRIQPSSNVPAKFYLYGRAGFLDLENAPRVYDANSFGAGLIASKGPFRNSFAQVGIGNSKQYESDKGFDRLKVNAVLVFDVIPGWIQSAGWKGLSAGSRFFIAIAIDRNPSSGPDAVQTYIGVDYDLRHLFGSF